MDLPSNVKRIAFLADYVPRQCGIATFTADLREAIAAQYSDLHSSIIAVTDRPEGYHYPSEVRFEIPEQDISAYRRAADFLNLVNVDVLCLQHEFGIFGGPSGRHLLTLLRNLRMPVVTTLHTILRDPSAEQKRVLRPDPESEKGFYYRSDHFNFAKKGVPALYTDTGVDFVGKPAEYSQQKRDEYTNKDYHAPSDQIKPDWDLTGAVDDSQLLFLVGYRVANARKFPEWKPGNEFKATRDAMLK